jgi:type 1 glutamine amidotransferase
MNLRLAPILILFSLAFQLIGSAQEARFHVLALYSTNVESDHVDFAKQAIVFFEQQAKKDHFDFQATTDWDVLNSASLVKYQVVLWLDDSPHTAAQRNAFELYMTHGGAWMGFHAAGYNDESTHWPWFVDFLGAVFYGNSWPPLPARIDIDDRNDSMTRRLPASYLSPANEWYSWKPDPRDQKSIKVLATLDPANYPIGLKDTLTGGDIPVAWSNTRYRMVYMNMGHGDKIFDSPVQNTFFEDALLHLGEGK